MPRLTPAAYQTIHEHLRQFWLHDGDKFYLLSPTEQWLLHTYFMPDVQLSADELASYRREVTKQNPSLPQRAGRAFTKLLRELDAENARREARAATQAPRGGTSRRRPSRNADRIVTVRSVVRPEPDKELLARALVAFVKERERREDHEHHDRDQAA
jgi:hypothetical protein